MQRPPHRPLKTPNHSHKLFSLKFSDLSKDKRYRIQSKIVDLEVTVILPGTQPLVEATGVLTPDLRKQMAWSSAPAILSIEDTGGSSSEPEALPMTFDLHLVGWVTADAYDGTGNKRRLYYGDGFRGRRQRLLGIINISGWTRPVYLGQDVVISAVE